MKTTVLTLAVGVLSAAGLYANEGRHDGHHEMHKLPPSLAAFDVNHDGVLDATERAAVKAAADAKRAAFIAKYDTNGDGVLSADELAAARVAIQADHEAAEVTAKTARFATLDTDSSGGLTLAELTAGLPNLSAKRVAALFAALDTDASGAISLVEFVADPVEKSHHGHR